MLYTYVQPASDLMLKAFEVNFKPYWLGSYVISGPELLHLVGPEASTMCARLLIQRTKKPSRGAALSKFIGEKIPW